MWQVGLNGCMDERIEDVWQIETAAGAWVIRISGGRIVGEQVGFDDAVVGGCAAGTVRELEEAVGFRVPGRMCTDIQARIGGSGFEALLGGPASVSGCSPEWLPNGLVVYPDGSTTPFRDSVVAADGGCGLGAAGGSAGDGRVGDAYLGRFVDGQKATLFYRTASTTRVVPHIRKHSPDGLSWGYNGAGPRDTAYAMLRHHLRRSHPTATNIDQLVDRRHVEFADEHIGVLTPNEPFEIYVATVRAWVEARKVEREVRE